MASPPSSPQQTYNLIKSVMKSRRSTEALTTTLYAVPPPPENMVAPHSPILSHASPRYMQNTREPQIKNPAPARIGSLRLSTEMSRYSRESLNVVDTTSACAMISPPPPSDPDIRKACERVERERMGRERPLMEWYATIDCDVLQVISLDDKTAFIEPFVITKYKDPHNIPVETKYQLLAPFLTAAGLFYLKDVDRPSENIVYRIFSRRVKSISVRQVQQVEVRMKFPLRTRGGGV
jgi:hypothetical protein